MREADVFATASNALAELRQQRIQLDRFPSGATLGPDQPDPNRVSVLRLETDARAPKEPECPRVPEADKECEEETTGNREREVQEAVQVGSGYERP
jgi:hypothetical protein